MYDQHLYLCYPISVLQNLCKTEIIPFTNYYVSWVFRVAHKVENLNFKLHEWWGSTVGGKSIKENDIKPEVKELVKKQLVIKRSEIAMVRGGKDAIV